jgi:hypothetical protein
MRGKWLKARQLSHTNLTVNNNPAALSAAVFSDLGTSEDVDVGHFENRIRAG